MEGWGGWRGIGVCDCQLWERDPPGGVKVQENRKKEQKIEKKESKWVKGWGEKEGKK